jgi:hypothetical protein
MALERKVSIASRKYTEITTYSRLVEKLDWDTDGARHDCGSGKGGVSAVSKWFAKL